jgi:hypothetical protein
VGDQLVPGQLRPARVEHEPVSKAGHGGEADIHANDQVAEEHPAVDDGVALATRLALHDVCLGWVEAKGGGGKTVGDQVNPEQLFTYNTGEQRSANGVSRSCTYLDGDQRLRHAKRGGQEDAYNLADVGRDEIPNDYAEDQPEERDQERRSDIHCLVLL